MNKTQLRFFLKL